MAVVGLCLVVAGYGAYLAMLFILHRFTYRTWMFDAAIAVGIGFATVGLFVGDPPLLAWIAIGLGLVWFPLTRRALTLYGSERLTIKPGDRLPSFAALRPDGKALDDQEVVAHAPAIRPSTVKRHLADLCARSGLTTER
jgi:hypothetical protein